MSRNLEISVDIEQTPKYKEYHSILQRQLEAALNLEKGPNILEHCRSAADEYCVPVEAETSTVLVLGAQNGGKTTLINSWTKKLDLVQPTLGLGFSYVRERTYSTKARTCYIWEIGGDALINSGYLKTALYNCHSISRCSIFLVIDLSQPERIWDIVVTSVDKLQKIIDGKLENMDNASRSEILELIDERRKKLLELGNANIIGNTLEQKCIEPFPIPLTLVGTKYDLFKSFDSEKKRKTCLILRLLAHHFGASLTFYSSQNIRLRQFTMNMFNYLAFNKSWPGQESGSNDQKLLQFNEERPLQILCGTDLYAKILPETPPTDFTINYLKQMFTHFVAEIETKAGPSTEKEETPKQKTKKKTPAEISALLSTFNEPDVDKAYEFAMSEIEAHDRRRQKELEQVSRPETGECREDEGCRRLTAGTSKPKGTARSVTGVEGNYIFDETERKKGHLGEPDFRRQVDWKKRSFDFWKQLNQQNQEKEIRDDATKRQNQQHAQKEDDYLICDHVQDYNECDKLRASKIGIKKKDELEGHTSADVPESTRLCEVWDELQFQLQSGMSSSAQESVSEEVGCKDQHPDSVIQEQAITMTEPPVCDLPNQSSHNPLHPSEEEARKVNVDLSTNEIPMPETAECGGDGQDQNQVDMAKPAEDKKLEQEPEHLLKVEDEENLNWFEIHCRELCKNGPPPRAPTPEDELAKDRPINQFPLTEEDIADLRTFWNIYGYIANLEELDSDYSFWDDIID